MWWVTANVADTAIGHRDKLCSYEERFWHLRRDTGSIGLVWRTWSQPENGKCLPVACIMAIGPWKRLDRPNIY